MTGESNSSDRFMQHSGLLIGDWVSNTGSGAAAVADAFGGQQAWESASEAARLEGLADTFEDNQKIIRKIIRDRPR